MEVEDKQQLCLFESHDFISLMFPAYISLNTNEPCTDYSNTYDCPNFSVQSHNNDTSFSVILY